MNASDALLDRIRADRVLSGYLEWPGDFDISRLDPVDELRLPDGSPLEPVAGCGGGGTYFLCGEPGTEPRPVLYADSEGRAALIGADLVEAVSLIASLPYWQDLAEGTELEEMRAVVAEDLPVFAELHRGLLTTLGIEPLPPDTALRRLRAAVERTVPDFLPVTVTGGVPYDPAFTT